MPTSSGRTAHRPVGSRSRGSLPQWPTSVLASPSSSPSADPSQSAKGFFRSPKGSQKTPTVGWPGMARDGHGWPGGPCFWVQVLKWALLLRRLEDLGPTLTTNCVRPRFAWKICPHVGLFVPFWASRIPGVWHAQCHWT